MITGRIDAKSGCVCVWRQNTWYCLLDTTKKGLNCQLTVSFASWDFRIWSWDCNGAEHFRDDDHHVMLHHGEKVTDPKKTTGKKVKRGEENFRGVEWQRRTLDTRPVSARAPISKSNFNSSLVSRGLCLAFLSISRVFKLYTAPPVSTWLITHLRAKRAPEILSSCAPQWVNSV